jgi:replicative DNA helicase
MSQKNKRENEVMAGVDAEVSLLGALLLDNSAYDRISDKLRAEHFYVEQHRDIFTELTRQISSGQSADVVTVGMAMMDKVSMPELNQIAQYVPSAANIHRYTDLVIERFKSRALLQVSAELTELASDHTRSIEDRVECAQGQLMKLVDESPRDDWVGAYEAMVAHTTVLDDRAAGNVNAWPTGLRDIDDVLEGGLRPGELIIIGARPSMGKTALGMTIGLNMATDYSVGMLSMEMSRTEVNDRMTAMLGRVGLSGVKRPSNGEGLAFDRVVDAVEKSRKMNFFVSDQGGLNINQVRSKARNMKRRHGLNVLIVDYLGLMSGLDSRSSRAYQIEEITRGLKTLCKELDCAIVCLAQLNRKVEERVDAMPNLSDLRDSGAIEQDANVIIFVHRPKQAKPDLSQEWDHYAKASVAKSRNGPCGVVNLFYQGNQTRFDNWSGHAPTALHRTKREAP